MKLKARKNSTVHCCVKKFYKKKLLRFLYKKNFFVTDKYKHDLFVFICDERVFCQEIEATYQFKYCKNKVHSR